MRWAPFGVSDKHAMPALCVLVLSEYGPVMLLCMCARTTVHAAAAAASCCCCCCCCCC